MNEFRLINDFFKTIPHQREDVILGIGDDAACLNVPDGQRLFVSMDTLVSGVHFLPEWDPYDIAYRSVMVNLSDLAAMAATPAWITLGLTLPKIEHNWLTSFAQGIHDACKQFNIALVGGDTTRGPLCITITIHGFAPPNQMITRSGAKVGDKIYVSGRLGAAGQALASYDSHHQAELMGKLLHPRPRIDLQMILRNFATAAIDISDGLAGDLGHICMASQVGAGIEQERLPIHPLVNHYQGEEAFDFSMKSGDDYELCFTVSEKDDPHMQMSLRELDLVCFYIGKIEEARGLRVKDRNGQVKNYLSCGFQHF